MSAYLGILCHCLSGLCPADSDRSWNSPGLLSEIHFSVSFPDHECLWLPSVLTLSPLNVNLLTSRVRFRAPECLCHSNHLGEVGRTGDKLHFLLRASFLRRGAFNSPVQHFSPTLSVACVGGCQADVVTTSEPAAEPKWLVSVVAVVRSCMTLTIKISINSSSLVFKVSILDWGCFSSSYPGVPDSIRGQLPLPYQGAVSSSVLSHHLWDFSPYTCINFRCPATTVFISCFHGRW